MKASHSYDFGKVDIYDDSVIAIMNEGVIIKPEYNKILVEIVETYFKNKLFGYITYRKHSYSVDPKIYIKTSQIENLVGFAIISSEQIHQQNVTVERLFLKKPMEIFNSIKDARKWIKELIKNR